MKTYLFKVSLPTRPPIWRTVEIGADQPLHRLHEAIFVAYDRLDEHLYSFFMSNVAWDDSEEYTHPFGESGDSAAETTIDELGIKPGKKFVYLFDYGDQWHHEVELLEVNERAEKAEYPRIVEREGESPPQYVYEDEDEDYDEEDEEWEVEDEE